MLRSVVKVKGTGGEGFLQAGKILVQTVVLFRDGLRAPGFGGVEMGLLRVDRGELSQEDVSPGMGSAGHPPQQADDAELLRKIKGEARHLLRLLKGGRLEERQVRHPGKEAGILLVVARVRRRVVADHENQPRLDADEVDVEKEIARHVKPVLLHSAERPHPGIGAGGRHLQRHFLVDRPFHIKAAGFGDPGKVFDDVGGRGSGIGRRHLHARFQSPAGDGLVAHEQKFFSGFILCDDGHQRSSVLSKLEYNRRGCLGRTAFPAVRWKPS